MKKAPDISFDEHHLILFFNYQVHKKTDSFKMVYNRYELPDLLGMELRLLVPILILA